MNCKVYLKCPNSTWGQCMCTQVNGFYIPDYLSVGCGAIVRIGQFRKDLCFPWSKLFLLQMSSSLLMVQMFCNEGH